MFPSTEDCTLRAGLWLEGHPSVKLKKYAKNNNLPESLCYLNSDVAPDPLCSVYMASFCMVLIYFLLYRY